VGDFSKEESIISIDPAAPILANYFDRQLWEARLRTLTAPFTENVSIVRGDASLRVEIERKYLITSEGTRIAENRTSAYLNIEGSILADDGDIVPLHLSYFSGAPGGLPSDELILSDVRRMIEKLKLLRTAPLADPYTGPAVLHARAAGVFFHEIFGHRVEGHRLKNEDDGHTFKSQIGQPVLPKSLSVVFDPTVSKLNGMDLNGHYQYDDEGVKARSVRVVDNGVLKQFLMSRTPLENSSKSNGHGRAQAGNNVASRQSNLIVENSKPVRMNDLRKMLLAECRKQKKPYGYLFMDVIGGFTTTGRFMPNAFNIFPTEVYRVYTDGRADELVRGVDLIGTPLAMFAEITAADDTREIFTGFCGAESGFVPVTAIAPSFFVKRIETQKKNTQQLEKSLLERPSVTNTPAPIKETDPR
jgi:TldD protein